MSPPPVQILSISCSFWENLAKSYVGAPTSGKSWIFHCNQHFLKMSPSTTKNSINLEILIFCKAVENPSKRRTDMPAVLLVLIGSEGILIVLGESSFWFRFRFIIHRSQWLKLDYRAEAEPKTALTKYYQCCYCLKWSEFDERVCRDIVLTQFKRRKCEHIYFYIVTLYSVPFTKSFSTT